MFTEVVVDTIVVSKRLFDSFHPYILYLMYTCAYMYIYTNIIYVHCVYFTLYVGLLYVVIGVTKMRICRHEIICKNYDHKSFKSIKSYKH